MPVNTIQFSAIGNGVYEDVDKCPGVSGFVKTFDIKLLEGRDFSEVLDNKITDRIIINETAKNMLGLKQPLHQWLQEFAYRIHIGWWIFFVSAMVALLIVLFTLIFQAIKAAVTNPLKSLRIE